MANEAHDSELRRMMNYALIKNCDMGEEMRQDCVDNVINAVERFQSDFESAARMVKEAMDKKYTESWVVIMGEGFGYEVTHEVKHVLWMFFGDVAVLVYKAGARQAGT